MDAGIWTRATLVVGECLRASLKLVFEATGEALRSRSFTAYLSPHQWDYDMNSCEILKVLVFVWRVFFTLIRNLDLQKVCVVCIKEQNQSLQPLRRWTIMHALWITQRPLGYWVNNWLCSFFDTNLLILSTGSALQVAQLIITRSCTNINKIQIQTKAKPLGRIEKKSNTVSSAQAPNFLSNSCYFLQVGLCEAPGCPGEALNLCAKILKVRPLLLYPYPKFRPLK